MQTFIPYPSFSHTAKCLDTRRLGKQIVEARQIYDILFRPETSKATVAQQHHPIVSIWRHWVFQNQDTLAGYVTALNEEWYRRFHYWHAAASFIPPKPEFQSIYPDLPEAFHFAHRSALVAKDFDHYDPLFSSPIEANPIVINPLWYHYPTKRWYTGRLSAPKTLYMYSACKEPTVEEWLADCKRRGLFDPQPRIVSK
jgi:hypothetical protein